MEKIYDIPDWVTPQTYDMNRKYTRKTYQHIPDWINAAYDRNHYGILPKLRVVGEWLGLLGICLLLCIGIQ